MKKRSAASATGAGRVVECSFLIPVCRDANLGDGDLHPANAWEWLDDELFVRFDGGTLAPGTYEGFYRDGDTGKRVSDRSRKYLVAVGGHVVDKLREMLVKACSVFSQKCIYLSVAGQVEFVAPTHDESLRTKTHETKKTVRRPKRK